MGVPWSGQQTLLQRRQRSLWVDPQQDSRALEQLTAKHAMQTPTPLHVAHSAHPTVPSYDRGASAEREVLPEPAVTTITIPMIVWAPLRYFTAPSPELSKYTPMPAISRPATTRNT